MLTLNVESAHIDSARHVHQRADRSRSHAVLTRSCFGYDALLAHASCQEDLTDGIVYLVCAGMVQVFSLQIELATVLLAHASGVIERAGPAHIVAQELVILLQEVLAVDNLFVLFAQVLQRPIEDFGDVCPAVLAVEAVLVNVIAHIHYLYIYLCFGCVIHFVVKLFLLRSSYLTTDYLTTSNTSVITFIVCHHIQKRGPSLSTSLFLFLSVWHMKASCFATIESSNHATTRSVLSFAYSLSCFCVIRRQSYAFLSTRQTFWATFLRFAL